MKQTLDNRISQLEQTNSHRFTEVYTKIYEERKESENAFSLLDQRAETTREELHKTIEDVHERAKQGIANQLKQTLVEFRRRACQPSSN